MSCSSLCLSAFNSKGGISQYLHERVLWEINEITYKVFSKSERPLPVITMIPACAHWGASFQDGGDGDNFTGPAERASRRKSLDTWERKQKEEAQHHRWVHQVLWCRAWTDVETEASDEEVINTAMKEAIPTKASTVNLNALGRTPIFETIGAGMRYCRM